MTKKLSCTENSVTPQVIPNPSEGGGSPGELQNLPETFIKKILIKVVFSKNLYIITIET
jgi:hypothetical protein